MRGIECGKDDAVALAGSSLAIGYIADDFERAISLMDRAQSLNPNLAMAWHQSGWVRSIVGQPDIAVEQTLKAATVRDSIEVRIR